MGKDKKERTDSRSRSRSKDNERTNKKDKIKKNDNLTVKDDELIKANEEFQKEVDKIKKDEGIFIAGLLDEGSYFQKEYNKREMEKKLKEAENQLETAPKPQEATLKPKFDAPIGGRTGGVYIPPHKLAQLQKQMIAEGQKDGIQHQKLMWELLRKSINGIINKVNIANIQNVIVELLNENILRGKGLLAKAVIKAQMASPNFTHVYTALIAVINTKLPDIADLIIRRVILQFQKAYKRNNKIVCMATTKMLAHLINQKVLSDFTGLQLLALLLENPTEDSVEIACDFMTECGQVLTDLTPAGVNAIFERFKGILHEGEIDRRVQYNIENLFATRKNKFKDNPGIIPELDLVEEQDQITHQTSLDDEIDGEEMINVFKFDPLYEKTEAEWNEIKTEILGEDNIIRLKTKPQPEEEEVVEEPEEEKIQDLTETDLINLRRTIYLTITNSVDFEECAHKILKMELGQGHEDEVCNMIIECCMQERTYTRFFGLLSQRFCQLIDIYKECYFKAFVEKFTFIHRLETNRLRNVSKLFAHLLYTDAIDWRVLECIALKQETTTSSSRIFLKILFQELAENMGMEKLNKKLQDPDLQESFKGLFPRDHPKEIRFAINFFTLIGLGGLTVELRNYLKNLPNPQQQLPEENEAEESSGSSSSSDSSGDSDSSDSDSDDEDDKNKTKSKVNAPVSEIVKKEEKHRKEEAKPRYDEKKDDRKERDSRNERNDRNDRDDRDRKRDNKDSERDQKKSDRRDRSSDRHTSKRDQSGEKKKERSDNRKRRDSSSGDRKKRRHSSSSSERKSKRDHKDRDNKGKRDRRDSSDEKRDRKSSRHDRK